MEYQVKGIALSTKLDYVHEHFGPEAEQRLNELLEGRLEVYPILTGAWYPFDIYVELLEAIARYHFGSDITKLQIVGAHSAESSFNTIYKMFLNEGGFIGFLRHHSSFHSRFYNQGRSEVQVHDDGLGCDLVLFDKPRFSSADFHVGVGFFKKAAELHGHGQIDCGFSFDEETARFVMRWRSNSFMPTP